jgi:hypothetical protein
MKRFNPKFFRDFNIVNERFIDFKEKWRLPNFNTLLSVNYLNVCYGAIRQLVNVSINNDCLKYLTYISNDFHFINAYNNLKRNGQIREFSIKEQIVLSLLKYHLVYVLAIVIMLSKRKKKDD